MTTLDKTHGTQRPQNPIANHFILYYKHNLISLLQQLKLNSSFKIKKKTKSKSNQTRKEPRQEDVYSNSSTEWYDYPKIKLMSFKRSGNTTANPWTLH